MRAYEGGTRRNLISEYVIGACEQALRTGEMTYLGFGNRGHVIISPTGEIVVLPLVIVGEKFTDISNRRAGREAILGARNLAEMLKEEGFNCQFFGGQLEDELLR